MHSLAVGHPEFDEEREIVSDEGGGIVSWGWCSTFEQEVINSTCPQEDDKYKMSEKVLRSTRVCGNVALFHMF